MIHAVALVPGFLGFDHLAERTYFADRFIAGLQAALESRRPEHTFVVAPTSTLPIDSLAKRQGRLAADLGKIEEFLGSPADLAWHLVGHSTGGLDAALFTRDIGLVEQGGRSIFGGDRPPNERVRSVTTIAAPLYGTCLTRAAVPAMTHGGPVTPKALGEALQAAVDVLDPSRFASRVAFGLGSLFEESTPTFISRLFVRNALAADLDPSVATDLVEAENRLDRVKVFSIATVAPRPTGAPRDGEDALFRHLWRWTQEAVATAPRPPSPLPASIGRVIRNAASGDPFAIEPMDSDGVVNTERQVDRRGVFAGLVVADHGDVIGRYRRRDPIDRQFVDPGLLTSGAEFGDAEFFQLLHLVADGIVRTIA